jgi:predicted ATPase
MAAGNGGQIVVSAAARELVGDPPENTALIDSGQNRLKDLGEPIGLFRLVGPGAKDKRQLRTLGTAPHNLPVQLSNFVGREAQIEDLRDLVQRNRLVTLTGIGGVGKTRLALQVAAEVLGRFKDGVWFVELAPLTARGLLAETVADSVGAPQESTVEPLDRVSDYLREHAALIILDNCEHLIDEVASFADSLLRSCPDVQLLLTSREGVAVTGEVLWRVPSLRVDEDAAAIELFADRARTVRPQFAVNDQNRSTIADLCERLDGIPLAIELATARLKMLSIEQIAGLLDDRFRLLTGGSRTAVERQRTLRAMMDWSHDLLSDQEQTLLRRLAVFYDGFTYEAAEEVCVADTIGQLDVLDLLGRLVEASLVTFEGDRRPRYRLLETVRQYSLDKLVAANEADTTRLRHASFFRDISTMIGERLDRGDLTVMKDGHDDLGNFRAAMTWATEAGEGVIALETATALRPYFWKQAMYRESLRWISAGLDLVADDQSQVIPRAAAFALTDSLNVADYEHVRRHERQVRALLPEAIPANAGLLANALATLMMHTDVAEADRLYGEAHRAMREAGDPLWPSAVQNRVLCGLAMRSRHAEQEILGLVDDAVAEGLATSIHPTTVRTAFRLLSQDYEYVIDVAKTHPSLDTWEETMLLLLALEAERSLGRLEEAQATIATAMTVMGPNAAVYTGWHRAMLAIQQGDHELAAKEYDPPFGFHTHGSAITRWTSAGILALIAERRGDLESAALLAGAGAAISEAASVGHSPFDEAILEESRDKVRVSIGDTRFQGLFQEGRSMPWADLPLVGDL